ncbi:MAG: HIT family protein [Epsilonproteobacteria bacterium]|nr:HIT family protein [Campylobacterota bacterium]
MIWQNENFFIEKEESPLPWVKLFTKEFYINLSDLPFDLKMEMFGIIEIIEKEMINFYNPKKINIASFGNKVPHLHWHIIARFENDPWFPNIPWEEKLREDNLNLPSFDEFIANLVKNL